MSTTTNFDAPDSPAECPEQQAANAPELKDLPWEATPVRSLLKLSWPICTSTISYAIYTLVDTWFVARLGSESLAAVSMGGVLAFSFIWLGLGILQAVKLKVSHDRGSGQDQQSDSWVRGGFRLAFRLGLCFSVAGLAIAPFIPYLTETQAAGTLAQHYVLIRLAACPITMLAAAQREALYGESESKIPLMGSLATTVTNIALDAWFILGLSWGVAGAALATAIAYGADLATMRWLDRRRRRAEGRDPINLWACLRGAVDPLRQKALWTLGWPIGVGNFMEIGAFTLLTVIVAQVGDIALAAHQIVLQTLHFAFLPIIATGEAASIMVSEALGAGKPKWILGLAWRCLFCVSIFTFSMAAVLGFGRYAIADFFTTQSELLPIIVELFWIAALFQLVDGCNIVARCVLRGARDIRFVTAVTVGLTWCTTCPLAYLFALHWGWGAAGTWWAIFFEIVLVACILWIRLFWRYQDPATIRS